MFLGIPWKWVPACSILFSSGVELIVKMSLCRIRNCSGPEMHCVFLEHVMIFVQVFPPRNGDFLLADRMGSPCLLFRELWEKEGAQLPWTIFSGLLVRVEHATFGKCTVGHDIWGTNMGQTHLIHGFGILSLKGMDVPSVSHPGTGNKLSLRKKKRPASLCRGSSWAQTPRCRTA